MSREQEQEALTKLKEILNNIAINQFGMTKEQAIEQNICISCKKLPEFYSEDGRKEYKITGLCEYCYDRMWDQR